MPTLRPIALACSLLAGLAVVPISAGQDAPGAALLRGRVTSKAGVPLVDARVRVAVPAADLRADDLGTNHRVFEARTDAEGRYLVDLGGITAPTSASIDAMAPGFRRLVGTFRAGGDAREVQIKPGATVEADLALEPARHYAGVVVDEEGRPIAGAQILSSIQSARSTGFIEQTSSGPDGAFDLYCYPFKLTQRLDEPCRGVVTFSHPDYQEAKVEDVDRVEPGRRGNLRIVMPAGRKVAGIVLDAGGKPVVEAMVEVDLVAGGHRKAVLTDADGRYLLKGLSGGASTLIASSLPLKQKARLPLALDADKAGIEVRLEPMKLPADLKVTEVLGMKLIDVTPAVKAAYDLYYDRGAVILDPGDDPDRLKIDRLAEGYCFWFVGDRKVGSVREFVDRILAEVGDRVAPVHKVRVVYGYKTTEFVGTNTQYLELTPADVEGLRAASARLAAGKP